MDLEKEGALYAGFMAETRDRLAVAHEKISGIRRSYAGSDPDEIVAAPWESAIEIESGILQIRFACELIALASLAAHSKAGLTKNLLKSWNAGKTFRMLADINEKCFPQPWKGERFPDGRVIFGPREALDQKGLAHIYERCGELLHRGMMSHILKEKKRVYDLPQLQKWIMEIQRLIAMHAILIERHKVLLFVTMAPPAGNPIEVRYGQFDPAENPSCDRFEFKEIPGVYRENHGS